MKEEKICDSEILDYLCDRCYLPNDTPDKGIFICIGEDIIPHGEFSVTQERDRELVREVIKKEIKKWKKE